MASDDGPVATEAPQIVPSITRVAVLTATISSEKKAAAAAAAALAKEVSRSRSLKRGRSITPTSPNSAPVARNDSSSPAKAARLAYFAAASRRSPAPQDSATATTATATVTATAAAAMSRPQDAPAAPGGTTTPTVPAAPPPADAETAPPGKVPSAVTIPPAGAAAQLASLKDEVDTSPRSATSAASAGAVGALVTTASPGAMDVDREDQEASPESIGGAMMEGGGKKGPSGSLSYPPVQPAPEGVHAPTARQMTLPPSLKKHKCPYCETEFTRHHNLKSHLLTHSQEKPYVCQACQMRFRRLHDLKRHSKLHTGEKPHICPKCERKFARGDALARHAKGPGGCAGRRSSMGSFGEGEEYDGADTTEADESAMSGVAYHDASGVDGDVDMTEEERRRLSLPAIKAQHIGDASPDGPGSSSGPNHAQQHSRTYPPAGPRSTGGLFPPTLERPTTGATTTTTMTTTTTTTSPSIAGTVANSSMTTSGHTPNTSISSVPPMSAGSSSLYSQSGMTESPKPLSPGAAQANQLGHHDMAAGSIARQRSPSLTSQFQQHHFGRRQSDRRTPPGLSLPSPAAAAKLPGMKTFAPPFPAAASSQPQPGAIAPPSAPSATALAATAAAAAAAAHQQQHSRATAAAAANAPHASPSAADPAAANNIFTAGDHGVWAYVQALEAKVTHLTSKTHELEEALAAGLELFKSEIAALNKKHAEAMAAEKNAA